VTLASSSPAADAARAEFRSIIEEKGHTVVLARRAVARLEIAFTDEGPGIPEHIREKIFDPFYTTRKDGHGIGLSFSHRVIENHGGTLSASGSEWGGAEFRVSLPLGTEGSPV